MATKEGNYWYSKNSGVVIPAVLLLLIGLSFLLWEFSDSVEGVSIANRYSGLLTDVDCSYRATYNRSDIGFTLDDDFFMSFLLVGINCDQVYAQFLAGSSVVAHYTRSFVWQVDVDNRNVLPFSIRKSDYNFIIFIIFDIPLLCCLLAVTTSGKRFRKSKNSHAG